MKGKITLIQILLICTFLICSVLIYQSCSEKINENDKFSGITETAPPTENKEDSTVADDEDRNARISKYKEVYAQNNDMVGWIRVKDTRIDYPVMQNKQSNAYYLHRNIAREYSSSGIPFMDYQCTGDATDDNTIIYAHNMRNGTMFHDLLEYSDREFYDSHKTIEFDTLTNFGEYEIFAVIRTKVGSKNEFKYYDFINAKTPAEFDKFISKCISLSLYKTEIIPKYGEKILTLSTCSYNTDNERFVVFAKKMFY